MKYTSNYVYLIVDTVKSVWKKKLCNFTCLMFCKQPFFSCIKLPSVVHLRRKKNILIIKKKNKKWLLKYKKNFLHSTNMHASKSSDQPYVWLVWDRDIYCTLGEGIRWRDRVWVWGSVTLCPWKDSVFQWMRAERG